MSRLAKWLGLSQSSRVEWGVFSVRNDTLTRDVANLTICLTPRVNPDGQSLSFVLPDNDGNILGEFQKRLDLKDGEKIIVMEITRTHYCNQLCADVSISMKGLFDVDATTDHIRRVTDNAMAMDNVPVSITVRPHPPAHSPPQKKPEKEKEEADEEEYEHLGLDPDPSSMENLYDSSVTGAPVSSATMEDALKFSDQISLRGGAFKRCLEEKRNEVKLGNFRANTTDVKHVCLYRASVSQEKVSWFAGQDRFVMEDPVKKLADVNLEGDAEARADKPINEYILYEQDHALFLFIRMYHDQLKAKPSDIKSFKGDRDDKKLLYQVHKDLVSRARALILHVVFGQMYYTTLRNCVFSRSTASSEDENILVRRLATEWKLKVDPKNGRVSDWERGEARPMVIITLRIDYYRVSNVHDSASTLHKEMTMLREV